MLKGCGGCWSALFSKGCCSSSVSFLSDLTPEDVPGVSSSTSLTFSSMLLLGLEHTEVFVLCDPWALGESIPESLGLSSFRALNGHFDSVGD